MAAGLFLGGGVSGIGGTSALERRPECHPVSVDLGGLETPLVPLKIFPFFVRGSRLPMRRSEEKMDEEVEVEEEEEEVEEVEAVDFLTDDPMRLTLISCSSEYL